VFTDVIAALATPAGRSALAVIRVSGEGAFEVAGKLVAHDGPVLAGLEPRQTTLVTLVAPDQSEIDRAMVTVFRAPASYTGQDLVEISCHGGLLVPAQVLGSLYAAGARRALPGEFTRRAVLGGKLDLLQAEAIGDLIDATAPAQARAALHQLDGGLSRRLEGLREELLELLALLSYDIDFPEEDEAPIPRERVRERLDLVRERVERLLATAPAGERIREGALVVLAGRPNAGKSSLFNALLGTSRALVTEIPGTTRDTIESATDLLGWPVRLADTAGIRDADERLEQMGIEVSRRYVAAADLLLLCAESGRALAPEERQILADRPAVLVRTKADLVTASPRAEEGISVSVITGEGLDRLREAIADRLFTDVGGGSDLEPMLTRERHQVALARAAAALPAARLELGQGRDPVLAAHHIQGAVEALEELIGVVHPEEVLGRIFERFCVGK